MLRDAGHLISQRQQLQEGKTLVEPREREECHLLQHPHCLAKIETSCFVVGNIKEKGKKEKKKKKKGAGRGCLREAT